MKISKYLSSAFTNKYVLYLVATIAFLNIFGYMIMGSVNAVIFFILVGYITSLFSKNMIIVLLVPMLFTNFFMAGLKLKEGFDSKPDNSSSKKQNANDTPIIHPLHTDETSSDDSDKTDESFKTRDQPLEYTKEGKHKKTRLDHSATVENAYDTLNKIIGGPGFSKMTEDTKRLMEQQQKLAQSMEQFGPMLDSIQPFLKQAQSFLGNVDIEGVTKMMENKKP